MGQAKLLLPFGTSTVIGSLVKNLRSGGVERIVLVAASQAQDLRAWALAEGLEVAINSHPDRGMLSSILAGLELLGGAESMAAQSEPLLVTPADLPMVAADSIRRLLEAFRAAGRPLALPTFRGKRGHPLVLTPSLIAELPHLHPGVGLKQILAAGHAVLEVEVEDPGVLSDVDTPDQYEKLRREYRGRSR